jgi:hypothetical protein
MKLNSDQKGHWYKCKKEECMEHVPLPDILFDLENELYSIPAKCKAGHISVFKKRDALSSTRQWEVDRYFDPKDFRSKIVCYWDESRKDS